jgi:DNA-binding GntR family transcriptional regulator
MAASSTRADLAYHQLRTDILHGRLGPGSRLRVEALSKQYGVSSGVIREALPRLVGQGLAVSTPQQGVRVVGVGAEDLKDLTEARVAIETLVLRRAILEGSIEWESSVLASHHNLSRIELHDADGEVSEPWAIAHSRFHQTLLEGCPNTRLKDLAQSLRDCAEVYRHWSDKPGQSAHRDIAAEHRIICDLTVARDLEAAVTALRDHIELTSQLILDDPAPARPPAPDPLSSR